MSILLVLNDSCSVLGATWKSLSGESEIKPRDAGRTGAVLGTPSALPFFTSRG